MSNPEENEIWKDPRFSHLVSDPRFKQLPQSKRRVKIDKRFESMFNDSKFKVKYSVDKYGRKVNKSSSEDLKKYYEIETSDEEEEDEERRKEEAQIAKDENDALAAASEDDEEVTDDLKQKLLNSKVDYARGEGRLLSDSSSDEDDSEGEEEEDELFVDHVWGELDNEAETTEESTRRLAVCNMDWDRIRATDIMIMCNSFLPPGGSVKSVTIYPSEFGKARMAEEEVNGPQELTQSSAKKQPEASDSEDDESDEELVKEVDSDAGEGDDYHMEKLRQYQLNRLKYYYGVIECDSVPTADKIYKECDGIEYESTATKIDLRFIPDDVTFDEDEPRDVCTELPDLQKYKPRLFTTTALQQAKVELTWDETSVERKELGDKISAGKLDGLSDADLKKYVAYSSEEEDENDAEEQVIEQPEAPKEPAGKKGKASDQINKYKSLLEEINKKEEDKSNNKFEMEYTWGLNVDSSSSSKKKKDKEATKAELTPIEKVLEKRREKNKRRKEERKKKKNGGGDSDEDDEEEEDNDIPDGIDMNDAYFAEEFANGDFEAPKSKKKGKDKKVKNEEDEEEEERAAKELELLMDDGDDKNHFSLEKIQRSENETKSKKKRKKLLKKSKAEISAGKQDEEENFQINVADDRFKSIYTSHEFSIDPTNPHFKKTKGMESIIHEKLKRRHGADGEGSAAGETVKRPKKQVEDSILVKNLKRKIQGKKF